ncbi:MAG TPA: hypothetical protein VFQ99_00080 [Gallionella sp.]|nr:hypothetical protein [Gallionella sp.]
MGFNLEQKTGNHFSLAAQVCSVPAFPLAVNMPNRLRQDIAL